jgi:hypothetical protein
MFLLDPRGGRRRKIVRDQLTEWARRSFRFPLKTSRDPGHRVRVLSSEILAHVDSSPVQDRVLVDRVRSRIGHVVSHAKAIQVRADHGTVTLSGPVPADEAESLAKAVASVPGVQRMENRLEVRRNPGTIPALQGSLRRSSPRALRLAAMPSARLIGGTFGLAIAAYGLSRWRGARRERAGRMPTQRSIAAGMAP